MKRAFALVFWGYVAALCCAPHALAQSDATFDIKPDRTAIYLGETLKLQVTVGLYKSWYDSLIFPRHRNFRVVKRERQKSQEAVYANGQAQVQHIWKFTLILKPKKAGFFTLSPGKLRAGRIRRTAPAITIEVRKGKPIPTLSQDQLPAYIEPQGDVFLLPVLSSKRIYVGQQATLSYFLFRRTDAHIDSPRLPRLTDFWSHPIVPIHALGDWQTRYVKDVQYRYTLALRYAIFPLRTGKLTIQGLSFRMQRSFTASPDQATLLQSPPITLEALELPTEDRPPNFQTQHVGRFTIQATLLQQQIRTHEPISFQVSLRGTGNIQQLSPPPLPDIPGAQRYSSQTNTQLKPDKGQVAGSKTKTYTIQVSKPGPYELPALSFSFFDPWQQKYVTVSSQPISFTALATPGQLATLLKQRNTARRSPPLPRISPPSLSLKSPRAAAGFSWNKNRGLLWLALPLPLLALAWLFLRSPKKPQPTAKTSKGKAKLPAQKQKTNTSPKPKAPRTASDSKSSNAKSPDAKPKSKSKDKPKAPKLPPLSITAPQETLQTLQQWLQQHANTPDHRALQQLESDLLQLFQAWLGTPTRSLCRQELFQQLQLHPTYQQVAPQVQTLLQTIDTARFSPFDPTASHTVPSLLQQFLQLPTTRQS